MSGQAKLYTEDEVRQAMVVGVGLGGEQGTTPPPDTMEKVEQALDIFRGGHGRVIPNYETFKRLQEERDWRGLAEAHLAAALMASPDTTTPHALMAVAAVGREALDELGHIGGVVDSLDTAMRAR